MRVLKWAVLENIDFGRRSQWVADLSESSQVFLSKSPSHNVYRVCVHVSSSRLSAEEQ